MNFYKEFYIKDTKRKDSFIDGDYVFFQSDFALYSILIPDFFLKLLIVDFFPFKYNNYSQ